MNNQREKYIIEGTDKYRLYYNEKYDDWKSIANDATYYTTREKAQDRLEEIKSRKGFNKQLNIITI